MSPSDSILISVAADHAGFALKRRVVEHLEARGGCTVLDRGPADASRVDYPDYAARVAEDITAGRATLGVLVCGTGIGMSLAANRLPGVRAAVVSDHYSARLARAHNDAQILCIGSRVIGEGTALELVDLFIQTDFEGGRHAGRVEKIHALEHRGG